jgi:hypothetical protein
MIALTGFSQLMIIAWMENQMMIPTLREDSLPWSI